MGKKVSRASLKISKINDKKQLDSLIKVLRPKVYITDSSSFKKLVQELTGNGESIPSPPPPKPLPVEKVGTFPVAKVGALNMVEDSESSLEASFDAPLDSFGFCNQVSPTEELSQSYNQTYFADTSSDPFLIHQQADLLAFQELESFLLDADQHPFCSSYSQFYHDEVSIYDYELPELI